MNNFFSHKRLLLAIAAAFTALLLVTACGGDDDDDVTGDDGPSASQSEDAGDNGGDDTDAPADSGDPGDGDGGNSGGDDGDAIDVCALLTDDEIAEATGIAATAEDTSFAPFYNCIWSDEELNTVNLSVSDNSDGTGETLFEINNDNAEVIDDLGDRAQFLGGILPLLEVITDDYYLSISVSQFGEDEAIVRDQAIELARLALDRLE